MQKNRDATARRAATASWTTPRWSAKCTGCERLATTADAQMSHLASATGGARPDALPITDHIDTLATPGHLPVRSYLAVPVISRTGEVLGGLFFGHATPGMFTERAEHGMEGLAAEAAVAIDNVRLASAAQRELFPAETAETAPHPAKAATANKNHGRV